jgi:hypothetical protein
MPVLLTLTERSGRTTFNCLKPCASYEVASQVALNQMRRWLNDRASQQEASVSPQALEYLTRGGGKRPVFVWEDSETHCKITLKVIE